MYLVNLERILPTFDDIVIEFIPESQSGKLRPWELGDGVKIQSIAAKSHKVENVKTKQNHQVLKSDMLRHYFDVRGYLAVQKIEYV